MRLGGGSRCSFRCMPLRPSARSVPACPNADCLLGRSRGLPVHGRGWAPCQLSLEAVVRMRRPKPVARPNLSQGAHLFPPPQRIYPCIPPPQHAMPTVFTGFDLKAAPRGTDPARGPYHPGRAAAGPTTAAGSAAFRASRFFPVHPGSPVLLVEFSTNPAPFLPVLEDPTATRVRPDHSSRSGLPPPAPRSAKPSSDNPPGRYERRACGSAGCPSATARDPTAAGVIRARCAPCSQWQRQPGLPGGAARLGGKVMWD